MKNKVYIYNLDPSIIDSSLAKEYYDFVFLTGEVEEYALCYSQAIIIYDPEKKLVGKSYDYFTHVLLVYRETLKSIIDAEGFLAFLDKEVGRKRLVNPRQFEIIKGSVVRSKVQPHLGAGYVKKIDEDQITVNFPKAAKILTKTDFICHKSVLRTITHIKEVQFEHEKIAG